MIEVLAAMTIASLLAAIAVPQYKAWVTRAHATEVAADLRVIRLAAYNFREKNGGGPAEAGPGTVPEGLSEQLPRGFEFRSDRYTWDWEHFQAPEGPVVGLAVTPAAPQLGWAIRSTFGNTAMKIGERYMFFIDSAVPLPVGDEVDGGDDGSEGEHPGRGRGPGGDPPGRGPDGQGPPGQDNKGRGNNSGQGNEESGSRGEDQRNERGNGGRSGR